MKTIEFKSKIRGNQILIPLRMRRELASEYDKNVRVMIFVDDSDVYDSLTFRQSAKNQFLKGYAETDDIYDL